MRIGLISDLHANLHALTQVLGELDEVGMDLVLCAGDVVAYGAHPNEVIEVLRERGIPCVTGNYDAALAWGVPAASRPSAPEAEARKQQTLAWTSATITAGNRRWLRGLPWTMRYQLDGRRLHVMHAGLNALDAVYLPADRAGLEALAARLPVDAVVFGHTHQAFVAPIGPVHCINPGAVGRSLNGNPRAAYAVLDTRDLSVRLLQTAYDIEAAAGAIAAAGMPEIAERVRKAER